MSSIRQVAIPAPGGPLAGVRHDPPAASRGALLLCHPLLEERKSAARPLFETARAAAAAGWTVLSFDYRGCGDSPGDFAAYSLPDWADDVAAAWAWLRAEAPGGDAAALGLRLGAALALRAAARLPGLSRLALWEPVLDGERHWNDEVRRKLVAEMLMDGAARSTRESVASALAAGQTVDLGGYAVTPRLHADLAAMRPAEAPLPAGLEAFAAWFDPLGRMPQAEGPVRDSLARTGARLTAAALREPPFWNAVGLVDTSAVRTRTVAWLCGKETAG